MTFAPVDTDSPCVTVDFVTVADLLQGVGALTIPVVAVVMIARIAHKNPAQALLQEGRRAGGVRLYRWGIGVVVLGVLAVVAAAILSWFTSELCDRNSGTLALSGVVLAVIGALLAGGGSAYAARAGWVVLATVAALDVWIFYISLLALFTEETGVEGLLLLAFAIHAICMTLASRWSFNAKDLGPIERAKAGEAGRSLAAVWVFLASYSALSILRSESGIFDSAAGSAVAGALTLGALAVTMGSGYTKYAEAIHAKPPGPPVPPAPHIDSAAGSTDLSDPVAGGAAAGSTAAGPAGSPDPTGSLAATRAWETGQSLRKAESPGTTMSDGSATTPAITTRDAD